MVAVLLVFFSIGFIRLSWSEGYYNLSKSNKSSSKIKGSHQRVAPLMMDTNAFFSNTLSSIDTSCVYFSTRGALSSKECAKYFFKHLLPLELSLKTWYAKFWIRALEYHPVLGILAPSKGRKYFHTKQWLFMSLKLLNLLFVDAIFAPIASPSENICSKFKNSIECRQPSSIDLIDSLCQWNDITNSCEFVAIDQNVGVIIITTLIIQLVSQPLLLASQYLVLYIANMKRMNYFQNVYLTWSQKMYFNPIENFSWKITNKSVSKNDESSYNDDAQRIENNNKVVHEIEVDNYAHTTRLSKRINSKMISSKGSESDVIDERYSDIESHMRSSSAFTVDENKLEIMEVIDPTKLQQNMITNIQSIRTEIVRRTSSSDRALDTSRTKEIYDNNLCHSRMQSPSQSDTSDDENSENEITPISIVNDRRNRISLSLDSTEEEEKVDNVSLAECVSSPSMPNIMMRSIENIRKFYLSPSPLGSVSSQRSKQIRMLIRLAARLRILQCKIDEITIDQEIDFLVNHLDSEYKSEMIEYTVHIMRHRNKLPKLIRETRQTSNELLFCMSSIKNDFEKEVYLAKKFILGLLRGVHKLVAQYFLFDEDETEVSVLFGSICFIILLLYVIASLVYVFLAVSSMGQNAAKLWLSCIAIVVFQGTIAQ